MQILVFVFTISRKRLLYLLLVLNLILKLLLQLYNFTPLLQLLHHLLIAINRDTENDLIPDLLVVQHLNSLESNQIVINPYVVEAS